VAERKAFLNRQQLNYRCSLRIDQDSKQVRFFETLSERKMGISSGGVDDFSSGFGFRVEKTSLSGKERQGSLKELSVLFGKKYSYNFDYGKIREGIKGIAEKHNYGFSIVLSERMVR